MSITTAPNLVTVARWPPPPPTSPQAPFSNACYVESPDLYECTRRHGHDGEHIARGGEPVPAGNGHPAWCDPTACIVDPTNGAGIHRHATVRAHGSAVVSTAIAAGDEESARLFLEVRDGDDLTP